MRSGKTDESCAIKYGYLKTGFEVWIGGAFSSIKDKKKKELLKRDFRTFQLLNRRYYQ